MDVKTRRRPASGRSLTAFGEPDATQRERAGDGLGNQKLRIEGQHGERAADTGDHNTNQAEYLD